MYAAARAGGKEACNECSKKGTSVSLPTLSSAHLLTSDLNLHQKMYPKQREVKSGQFVRKKLNGKNRLVDVLVRRGGIKKLRYLLGVCVQECVLQGANVGLGHREEGESWPPC